jgi:1,4-dihydroxy-2-naphthoate octaprenyltransferase
MFPPTHRIPIVIAAYRKAFVELAGQKADGYLARPAESIPSLRGILTRLERAATEAGRDPGEIETAGYLLALADRTRRAALNRAKREPFVIYMMAILSDISQRRAGFEQDLRDRIAAAWRVEDYTTAGNLIPDELLDAFILCGTREDIAEKAQAYHAEAGLQLPLLQPVVQEERQVEDMLAAAVLYSQAPATAPAPAERPVVVATDAASQPVAAATPNIPREVAAAGLTGDHRLSPARRIARFAKGAYEITRPFSFTASLTPVAVGGALAFFDHQFEWPYFAAAFIAALMLHAGTNVINEIYDVRKGIDTITSPRASHALVTGRVTERQAFTIAYLAFAIAALLGITLIVERGPIMLALGLAGLIGGWGYTAPPLQYKYHALGLPLVFLLMGPLMVTGSYFAVTGQWSWEALLLSIPVGMLVAAILHGNEWRDIAEDRRAGITTLSISIGKQWAHYAYLALVLGAFLSLGLLVAFDLVPAAAAVAILALPLLVRVIRSAELGASGQARTIAMIDLQTARLHFVFGGLLVAGVMIARASGG